jgi:hypothetical protein
LGSRPRLHHGNDGEQRVSTEPVAVASTRVRLRPVLLVTDLVHPLHDLAVDLVLQGDTRYWGLNFFEKEISRNEWTSPTLC